jgi:hypothetical protein
LLRKGELQLFRLQGVLTKRLAGFYMTCKTRITRLDRPRSAAQNTTEMKRTTTLLLAVVMGLFSLSLLQAGNCCEGSDSIIQVVATPTPAQPLSGESYSPLATQRISQLKGTWQSGAGGHTLRYAFEGEDRLLIYYCNANGPMVAERFWKLSENGKQLLLSEQAGAPAEIFNIRHLQLDELVLCPENPGLGPAAQVNGGFLFFNRL